MKKLIVLLLTIALTAFLFSCNNAQGNFNTLKKALADSESEMSMLDFNIKPNVRLRVNSYSNVQIEKTNDKTNIGTDEIGISHANWEQYPTGNWDSPFLQLTNESTLICDSLIVNSSYVFLFTFHYSMSSSDWGYFTYIPVYVSSVKRETPINELFFDFTPNLISGSYDSGVFYSLTAIDVYSAYTSTSQWAPFPVFDYRDINNINSNLLMYLNPSYLLYNGTLDDTKRFNTDVVALICYDRYNATGAGASGGIDTANISRYTTQRNLKYEIKQEQFTTYDTRFYRYNNSYYTFVQNTTPDENEMIFDANTTNFYIQMLNPNTFQYVMVSYWARPSNDEFSEAFEYFENNISQVLETNFTIEPTPPPDDGEGEGTTQDERFYRNLGIIASIPVLIVFVPIFSLGLAVYSAFDALINKNNFVETFFSTFGKVINDIFNFFTELTKDILNTAEKLIDKIDDSISDGLPRAAKLGIAAGVVAIILLIVGFAIYQIIKRRE